MRRPILSPLVLGSCLLALACGSTDDGPSSGEPGPGGASTADPRDPMDPTGADPGNTMEPVGTDPKDPVGADPMDPSGSDPVLALDECGLSTGWNGDDYCILAPPADQGFQLHYGPADYDDPDEIARYVMQPGEESNLYEPMVSGNITDVYFYRRQYRMRPGSHHLIVSEAGGTGGIAGQGRRLGGSQNSAKDNPTVLAPENVGLGIPLSATTSLSVNLHHFNGTTEPILREAWVNFWYVDPAEVTQQANEMFLWVQGPSVAPGDSVMVVGQWDIGQEGRVLTMYGHRHSNTPRFSAYRVRGTERTMVYDDYDWFEPSVFEFNSVTDNPDPDPASYRAGAHSGILDLLPGDRLEWECEIVNERAFTVTFGQNEAETSEMCILIGDGVGPNLLGFTL